MLKKVLSYSHSNFSIFYLGVIRHVQLVVVKLAVHVFVLCPTPKPSTREESWLDERHLKQFNY